MKKKKRSPEHGKAMREIMTINAEASKARRKRWNNMGEDAFKLRNIEQFLDARYMMGLERIAQEGMRGYGA